MRQKDKTKWNKGQLDVSYQGRCTCFKVSKGQLFLFSKINVIQVITFIQDIAQTL
jgi:hypothetical protein